MSNEKKIVEFNLELRGIRVMFKFLWKNLPDRIRAIFSEKFVRQPECPEWKFPEKLVSGAISRFPDKTSTRQPCVLLIHQHHLNRWNVNFAKKFTSDNSCFQDYPQDFGGSKMAHPDLGMFLWTLNTILLRLTFSNITH